MSISQNLIRVKKNLGTARLVAVSKTMPNEAIQEAYGAGQRIFGENKVQELVAKYETLPKDIDWHMIGHLQSNKVKYIAPFVALIHGVDSLKILKVINKEAVKCDRVIKCLLQVHIAEEETKFGFNEEELVSLLESEDFRKLTNVNNCGLMGMATYTSDEDQVKREFQSLRELFEKLKNHYFQDLSEFAEISMGMSGDYPLAIEEGSTLVRIGSAIFGARSYGNK